MCSPLLSITWLSRVKGQIRTQKQEPGKQIRNFKTTILLKLWFSAFLTLWSFNTVLYVPVTLRHKIISFITVMLLLLLILMQISVFPNGLRWPLGKGPFDAPKGIATHRLRTTAVMSAEEDTGTREYLISFTSNHFRLFLCIRIRAEGICHTDWLWHLWKLWPLSL